MFLLDFWHAEMSPVYPSQTNRVMCHCAQYSIQFGTQTISFFVPVVQMQLMNTLFYASPTGKELRQPIKSKVMTLDLEE